MVQAAPGQPQYPWDAPTLVLRLPRAVAPCNFLTICMKHALDALARTLELRSLL
jgi:hypothetical protein